MNPLDLVTMSDPERARKLAYWREYNKKNAERKKIYSKAYYDSRRTELVAYRSEYCEKNKEQVQATSRASYAKYKEKRVAEKAAYRTANRKLVNTNAKKYRDTHVEQVKQGKKEYVANNRGLINAKCKLRSVSKKNRTPQWLTADDKWLMLQAYELATLRTKFFGFKWHVDHKIPLNGDIVSGLHVPTNIQVIPGIENLRKRNKFEVIDG